ncbi:Hypothetical predicted protein [Marmota monax]|uniref:Uncharacterized protein n=1 Tax=Marmota monax TaxID=9995 RepID=A0A5E4D8Z4_MARMO|nr:hypothetical protein GHT09_002680 [Marmota monax]VTJ90516.1 Hypothetical predicted protein [Marmota monax]
MVPSQEEPAAVRGTSEEQPPGPAPVGEAPLSDPGPSEGSEAAAEKVEVEPREPREPPEGGWGWLVMLAAMWCNGSVFGIQNACGVLFVSMLKTFGSKDGDKMVFKTGEAQQPALGDAGSPSAFHVLGVCPCPSVNHGGSPCAGGEERCVCPVTYGACGSVCQSLCGIRCRDCVETSCRTSCK